MEDKKKTEIKITIDGVFIGFIFGVSLALYLTNLMI